MEIKINYLLSRISLLKISKDNSYFYRTFIVHLLRKMNATSIEINDSHPKVRLTTFAYQCMMQIKSLS